MCHKRLGIAYTQEGQGKDIVLLHGWGANKQCFALLINHLKQSYRVTAVDFCGFGDSDPPPYAYSVADYAQRLYDFLQSLNICPYAILGHSFGGRVAIVLLATHADFCSKLILVDSAGIRPRRCLRYYARIWHYKLAKKFFPNSQRLTKFGSSDYRALSQEMRATFVKVVNEDLKKYLRSLLVETLVVFGNRDRDTPIYMAKALVRGISSSGLVLIPNAGHFSFLDQPVYFLRVLQQFLSNGG